MPGGKVEPASLRQPRGDRGPFQPGVHGPGDSADHQRRAEEVLIGRGVGLRAFGPAVIKGPHQRLPQPEGALHGRVQIGQQPVAQAQRILHGQLRFQPIAPRLLAGKGAAAGMKPQDGRKNPQLQPTDGQLVVPNAVHVSANIVAPPRIARVGRHGGKPGLEGQRFPAHDGIAGKAHRAALAAGAGIPGQDQAPLAVPTVIPIMQLVEHPERIQPGNGAGIPLLPVDPPEIHAFFFQRMMQAVQIGTQESLVRRVEIHALLLFRIPAQRPADAFVGFLVGLHAPGGMEVQRYAHSPVVQRPQETGRVGEQLPVPGVARPSAAVGHVGQVPVHVDDRHGQRNLFFLKTIHQGQIAFLAVAEKTAPPVAQRPAGQQRGRTGQAVEIPQAGGVVVAVAEEVQVLLRIVPGAKRAVLPQNHGAAVVQHGKPVSGDQPVPHRNFPVRLIQRSGRAAQRGQGLPVAPVAHISAEPALDGKAQALRGEGLFIIRKMKEGGIHLHPAGKPLHLHLHRREISALDGRGGPILKAPLGLIFQPNQPLRQKSDTIVPARQVGGGHARPSF